MHSASPTTSVSLLMILTMITGCSHRSFDESMLPGLRQHQPHIIVQVPGDYVADQPREHPYYVVCNQNGCSAPTPKTPVGSGAKHIDPMIVPHRATQPVAPQSTALATHATQDPKRTNASPSYRRKRTTLLDKYRVHFDYASHRVGQRFQSLLREFVSVFSAGGRKPPDIRVTGYTDSLRVSTPTVGNEWLALERARSVKRKLVSLGYPEDKILLEAKFLCCYLDTNETESGRYHNRRAEITLIHFTE